MKGFLIVLLLLPGCASQNASDSITLSCRALMEAEKEKIDKYNSSKNIDPLSALILAFYAIGNSSTQEQIINYEEMCEKEREILERFRHFEENNSDWLNED